MKSIHDAVLDAISSLGLDAEAIALRKAFLGLSDADLGHLKKLHAVLDGLNPRIARQFYDHILQFPDIRHFITDERLLERLKQSQAEYFSTLTAGDYGPDYIHHRLRVGIAHQRIGLESQWYLGAYAKYLVDVLPEIWKELKRNPEYFIPAIQSLLKVILLDMGLAIDTYLHADRQQIISLKKYSELVVDASPNGLLVLNAELSVIVANQAFLTRFGVNDVDVRGQPILSLLSADGLEEKLYAVRDSGLAQHELLFKIGLASETKLTHVRTSITTLDIGEEEFGLLVIMQDMSEQLILQQALRESEDNLLRAQEVARIGSWLLDFKRQHLKWSPEVYRIFGLPPSSEINYDAFITYVHPEDRELVDLAWLKALMGENYHIQHRIVVNNHILWVEERARVEFDDHGLPLTAIGTVQEITKRIEAEKKIEYLAFYDSLTGLPNRALLMDRLTHALSSAQRNAQPLSLLFIDLDRFKEINDTLGHPMGDRVLIELSQRLRSAVREEEILARLSGDEFVVLASGTGEGASRIAERIIQKLSTPMLINGHSLVVSASIGIATFPEDGGNAESLLKHADIAMYLAKSRGGYCFYRAELGANLSRKLTIAQRLEKALTSRQLKLHYQPQVHMPTGQLCGAEALARWEDAEFGMISPAEFISIAEERGLISTLGEWVLHEACCQRRRWHMMSGRLAVNVSAKQFEDDDFIDRVLRIARETHIPPNAIELELTESGMMRDPERAIEITYALVSAGFTLSIDDFGTGYSSLSYLKRFPVNKLKIDMSFVHDMLNNSHDYAIVNMIIGMANSMGIETLAEGVENAQQAQALMSLGCQLAQGYHYGRPQSADDLERTWLRL